MNKIKKTLWALILTAVLGSALAATTHHTTTTHIAAAKHKKYPKKHPKHYVKVKAATTASTGMFASIAAMVSGDQIDTNTSIPSNIPIDKINMAAVANQPQLYSHAALAADASNGQILVSKNPNTQLPIASISKLMTAMVTIDSGANMDEYVTITDADVDNLRNTFSRLRVGMSVRRRDLLLLALMSSENRAAHALGRTAYPGGMPVFLQKMKDKCRALGMAHTQFYDPTGLTTSNQSTAQDLARMVQAAFTYPQIRQFTTTKGADVQLGKNYVHHYLNSDALVRAGKLQIALSKTGFINEAGHCLVLYSIIDKQPIIMVFLNSSGKSGRLIDAITVKNYVHNLEKKIAV